MTSLERQLKNLRSAASTQLGVERSYASLLFDKKEAGTLYVENALKIGKQFVFFFFEKVGINHRKCADLMVCDATMV